MPFTNKLFKVFLPVATATTATIFTVYLVAAFTKELNKNKEEDPLLDNFESKLEDFKEEIKVSEEVEENAKEEDTAKDSKQDTANEQPDSKEEKNKKEPENADEAMKALEDTGKNILEFMERSKTTQESDQLNIQVPENLHSDSDSSHASTKLQDNEEASELPSGNTEKQGELPERQKTKENNEGTGGKKEEEVQLATNPITTEDEEEVQAPDVSEEDETEISPEGDGGAATEQSLPAESEELREAEGIAEDTTPAQEHKEGPRGPEEEQSGLEENEDEGGELGSNGEDPEGTEDESVEFNPEYLRRLLGLEGQLSNTSSNLQALLSRSK